MTMRNSSLNSLHNEFRPVAIELYERMVRSHQSGFVKYRFDIFETLRSFDRQNDLFAKGVTKARAGDSAHNFGLAIDLVPFLRANRRQRSAYGPDGTGRKLPIQLGKYFKRRRRRSISKRSVGTNLMQNMPRGRR